MKQTPKCIHHWVIENHQEASRRWTDNKLRKSQRKFNSICKKCGVEKTFKPSTYETHEGNPEGLRGIKGVGIYTNHEKIIYTA